MALFKSLTSWPVTWPFTDAVRTSCARRCLGTYSEVLRSHLCGSLTEETVGQSVCLSGWLHKKRMEKFLILRDWTGTVQILIDDNIRDSLPKDLPLESVIQIKGIAQRRPKGDENADMSTGQLEVHAKEVTVLNAVQGALPFSPLNRQVNETIRLQHRYLDFRTVFMQKNLRLRSSLMMKMRRFLHDENNFVDVETPYLFRRTPGGAREFLVPSQQFGKFYSLTQSPQQFKQLLMVGGLDRYFQIARCFRDETNNPEKQPEFTQLDLEMSFINQESIINLIEDLIIFSWPDGLEAPPSKPFPRMTYETALCTYGSDKPDVRYAMTFVDLTDFSHTNEIFHQKNFFENKNKNKNENEIKNENQIETENEVGTENKNENKLENENKIENKNKNKIENKNKNENKNKIQNENKNKIENENKNKNKIQNEKTIVQAFVAPKGTEFCRTSFQKSMEDLIKREHPGVKLFFFRLDENKKILSTKIKPEIQTEFLSLLKTTSGKDLIVVCVGKGESCLKALGRMRIETAEQLERGGVLQKDGKFRFLWVVDFPLFERTEGADGKTLWTPAHHPFTAPRHEDTPLLQNEERFAEIRGQHYDLVLNGSEVGGGSIRVHNFDLQKKILSILKIDSNELKHLLAALQSGCPPHGGVALGLDRLVSIFAGAKSIRDVIAFPKTTGGNDLMSQAPCSVPKEQLDFYHIACTPEPTVVVDPRDEKVDV